MRMHSFISMGQRSAPVLSLLSGLLIALQVMFTFSPTAQAAQHADPSPDVAFAGVSVVRLLVTYSDAKAKNTPAFAQCTGLGVIVRSWRAQSNEQNNWILTAGSLVSKDDSATCLTSHAVSPATLEKIDIYFSEAFHPQMAPLAASEVNVHCQAAKCADGMALVSFNSSASNTYPFVDLAESVAVQGPGINPLGLVAKGNGQSPQTALTPTNENTRQSAAFIEQASKLLTPQSVPLAAAASTPLEPGTPIVNNVGNLTGLVLNSSSPQDLNKISDFLDTQPELSPSSQSPHINSVHDNWKEGITSYYQGNNYPAAQTAFKAAADGNALFEGAKDFEQLAASHNTPSTEQNPDASKSAQRPNSGGFTVYGIPISTLQLLIIIGLVVLGFLLIITSLLFGRAQARRRRLLKEYAEAERSAAAAVEAQRAAERETAGKQEPVWAKKTLPPPVAEGVGSFLAANSSHSGPLSSELHCPNCRQPVKIGANFCSNCRMALSPSESGYHLRVQPTPPPQQSPTQYPAPVAPAPQVRSSSLMDQPTVEMSPSLSQNGQVTGEHTVPYGQVDEDRTQPFGMSTYKKAGGRLGFAVGTRSDPGIKRKYRPNEDSLLAVRGADATAPSVLQYGLFVIADGMGGHANGQDASRRAIQTVVDFMLPRITKEGALQGDGLSQLLADAVQHANQAVHQQNVEKRADMGTTMTATLVVGSIAYVSNVGDSRTYLYREGEGLRKVTNDHSVVASLVEAGIIKPDDIYTHPKRNQIYRSLGEKPSVEVDSFTVQLQPGDKLILCSDGLWDMVRDPKLEEVIRSHVPDANETADALIQAALEGGGEDNVSVIVVSIVEGAGQSLETGIQLLSKPETVQMPQVS